MKKQNDKENNPEIADVMVRIYKHNFLIRKTK